MTQTQILLAIFVPTMIPTFAVLIGILLNKSESSKLDARMSQIESRLDLRIGGLESRFHADMMMVIGKLTELEVRVAKLETQRQ